MSGPVLVQDSAPDGEVPADSCPPPAEPDAADELALDVSASRPTEIAGHLIYRALPQRPRRTVGAWCFADHLTPTSESIGIGPHPHIGLHTVTWLIAGEMLHRDSLGSEQLIRPGQLNLMTAGRGVVHAEESPPGFTGERHGIQLWVAQPERTRHGEPAFEHLHDLPHAEVDDAVVTVLVGELGGVGTSSARHDTDLLGADIDLRPGRVALPLRPDHEHALIVLQGEVAIEGRTLHEAELGYLRRGRDEVEVTARDTARVILLGGTPFGETLSMWWNFVARDHDEITAAFRDWQAHDDSRFAAVPSVLGRIDAPQPPWLRSAT